MPSIGSLFGILSLDSGAYRRGLRRAENATGQFSRRVVRNVVAIGTAYIGVSAAVNTFQSGLTRLDAIEKTSQKLAIGTKELAAYRFAAQDTANMASGPFDTALQRMVRRVSEAAMGTGEAQKALKEMRLDARSLARQSPDKIFARIADEFQNIDSQGDRVRLAMRLFDTEGVALVNTLALGSEGLADFQRRAENLGIALDGRQTAAAARAKSALDQLGAVGQGLGNIFTVALAPSIAVVSEQLLTAAESSDLFKSRGLTAARDVGREFAHLLNLWDDLGFEIVKLDERLLKLSVSSGEFSVGISSALDAQYGTNFLGKDIRRLLDFQAELDQATSLREAGELRRRGPVFDKLGDKFLRQFEQLTQEIENGTPVIRGAGTATAGLGAGSASAAGNISTLGAAALDAAAKLDSLRGGSGGSAIQGRVGQIDRIREQAERARARAEREAFAGRTAFEPTERERRFATATQFEARSRELNFQADTLQGQIPGFEQFLPQNRINAALDKVFSEIDATSARTALEQSLATATEKASPKIRAEVSSVLGIKSNTIGGLPIDRFDRPNTPDGPTVLANSIGDLPIDIFKQPNTGEASRAPQSFLEVPAPSGATLPGFIETPGPEQFIPGPGSETVETSNTEGLVKELHNLITLFNTVAKKLTVA